MRPTSGRRPWLSGRLGPLFSALVYFVIAGAWILLSDRLALLITRDPEVYARLQSIKGFLFIFVMTLLVYGLIRREVVAARKADDSLIASEHLHRQMFERNKAVQLLVDPEAGQILDANPAAVAFYGYSLDTLRTMRITDINVMPRNQVQGAMSQAAAAKRNVFRFPHRLASGEIRDVDVLSGPVDLDGRKVLYSIIHDVTEQVRAEEALRDSEQRIRAIFDQTFQFIGLLNPDGTIVETNSTGLQFAGLTREDVIGKPFWEIRWWQGSMRERVRRAVIDAARGRLVRAELEMSGLGDEPVTVDFSIRPVTDDSGQVILLIPEARDSTDLKRAVLALRETNQTFEALFQSSPQPIIALDRAGNVKMWNPAATSAFGWTSHEVLGMPFALADEEHRAHFEATVEAALAGESRSNVELAGVHKNGATIHLSLSSAPLRDAGGEIDGVMLLAMDITRQRKDAEALRQSEAELRALFEAMTDAILVLDSAGRYVKVAPTGLPLLVQPPDVLTGKTLYEVFPLEDARCFHDYIRLALDSGEPVKVEYELPINGAQVWFTATISRMLEDRVVWIARDITERKRFEALQSALYRIADITAAAEDMDAFYSALHRIVGELMYAGNFYIALLDPATGMLSFPYFVDEVDPPPELLDPGEGLTGAVLRTGQPLWVAEEEMRRLVLQSRTVVGTPSLDWLGVPLKRGDDTFGVLAVQSYSPDIRFEEQDLELLIYVSKHIATALGRKQAAEALRQSEERYRTLIETSPDAVAYADLEGHVLLANDQAAQLYGFEKAAQLYGIDAHDFIPFEGWEDATTKLRAALAAQDRLANFETALKRHDGSQFPAEMSLSLIRDADGMPQGTIVVARDITERKRTEAAEYEQRMLAEALRDSAAALGSTLNLDEVLDHILDNLGRVVPYSAASIILLNGDTAQVVRWRGYLPEGVEKELVFEAVPIAELPNLVEMATCHQPQVIEDTAAFEGWRRSARASAWIRSYVGAPIIVGGEVIGFLNLDSGQPGFFKASHARRLQAFANQAAVAIENARLYESERRQREIAIMMRDTTAAVASSLDPGQVLLSLATRLREISGFHACMIYEWDRDEDIVRAVADHARALWSLEVSHPYLLAEYPTTLRVLETGEPVFLDIRNRDADPAERAVMQFEGLNSLLMMPLYAGDRVIGVAEIGSFDRLLLEEVALERCNKVLKEAARWLVEPLRENDPHRLQTLSLNLGAAAGAEWCALSEWVRGEAAVRAVAEYSDLVWPPSEGPVVEFTERSIRTVLDGQTHRVVRFSDPNLDPPDRERLMLAGMRMMVLQPLSVKGSVIGLVELAYLSGEPWISEEDLRLWRMVVDQAAVALENAHLYAKSQERNQQLALLNEITRIGTATLDLHELLQTLADTAGQIIGGDGCYITLWDAQSQRTVRAAAYGDQRHTYAELPPPEPGDVTLTASVLAAGHPLAIEDAFNTPYMDRKFAEQHHTESLLALPLRADGRDIGALLIGFDKRHRFTTEEIRRAEQAGELISLAVAKAQAYAELEERVEERTAQLRSANQRLVMLTQLRDEFVANVSHELRTPITSIKLHHHLLTARPEKSEVYMARLVRETERLEFIINDLLRLSELDRGGLALNLTPTDLNTLAQVYITDRTLMAEEHGLSLSFEPAESLCAVPVDQKLIGQALGNLLTNALNYTPSGGEVVVSTDHYQSGGEDWVILSVRDTGPGIAIEEQEQLFQRFFRGKAGRDSERAGTGLGLAIAHEIVERHGGRIQVTSDGIPGLGSTFRIWLPVEPIVEPIPQP